MNTVLESDQQRRHSRAEADGSREVIIRRTRGWRFLDLRELWAYRELVFFLT